MVVVFSIGLALILSSIGLVMVSTKSYLQSKRKATPSKLYRFLETRLPVLGALIFTLIGGAFVLLALIRLDLIDPTKFTV